MSRPAVVRNDGLVLGAVEGGRLLRLDARQALGDVVDPHGLGRELGHEGRVGVYGCTLPCRQPHDGLIEGLECDSGEFCPARGLLDVGLDLVELVLETQPHRGPEAVGLGPLAVPRVEDCRELVGGEIGILHPRLPGDRDLLLRPVLGNSDRHDLVGWCRNRTGILRSRVGTHEGETVLDRVLGHLVLAVHVLESEHLEGLVELDETPRLRRVLNLLVGHDVPHPLLFHVGV